LPQMPNAVTDPAAREAAYMTLTEVSFILAMRGARLPAEMGRPDLFDESIRAARLTSRAKVLSPLIARLAEVQRSRPNERYPALALFASGLNQWIEGLESWFLVEVEPRARTWVEELESGLSGQPEILAPILPRFYDALRLPDAEARKQKVRQRAVQLLIKDKRFEPALETLGEMPDRQPKLEAVCHEGLNDFEQAAACYREAGSAKDALRCYRLIPNIPAAIELAKESGDVATAEALEWLGRLHVVIEQRPASFAKSISAAEKKMMQDLLEKALGVTRAKAATKKAATKKAPAKKAAPPKTSKR
jgi:hypothetical protein